MPNVNEFTLMKNEANRNLQVTFKNVIISNDILNLSNNNSLSNFDIISKLSQHDTVDIDYICNPKWAAITTDQIELAEYYDHDINHGQNITKFELHPMIPENMRVQSIFRYHRPIPYTINIEIFKESLLADYFWVWLP